MKILSLKTENFRSLEHGILNFPHYYTAISGKNNSGKSNVLRALTLFFSEDDPYGLYVAEPPSITFKSDYTKWRAKVDASIYVELSIAINRISDAGLFRFVDTFLSLQSHDDVLRLTLGKRYHEGKTEPKMSLSINSAVAEDYYQVQEIHKKMLSSRVLFFHNSTERRNRFYYRHSITGFAGEVPPTERIKLKQAKDALINKLRGIAKKHKADIAELLGRLEDKYEVSVSVPTLDFDEFPLNISLGTKSLDIPLEDWGSGTQNRTMILSALLRAKKVRETASESDKITPIIVIEEPESFLHPSAQAEFGKILRDIATEFEVQVIATTHSPYMLSVEHPESNLLLSRKSYKPPRSKSASEPRETYHIETSGDQWMEPFALSLGLNNMALLEWKDVIFKDTKELLLVEGETDKKYFESLCDAVHGNNRLQLQGDIFPYGGVGFFDNAVVLKFILNRFKRIFITYDLDADNNVSKKLQVLGLSNKKDYIPIGLKQTGRSNIEGLLPNEIKSSVYEANPDLVDAAANGNQHERTSAKNRLKTLNLEAFTSKAKPEDGHYNEFYKVVKVINKALKAKREN